MKEMFSKILKVFSFVIGFCSKLFGKDQRSKTMPTTVNHIRIGGNLNMTFYCYNTAEILDQLNHLNWNDLRIQHPDLSCEEKFSNVLNEHEEEPLADSNSLLEDYVERMNASDVLVVYGTEELTLIEKLYAQPVENTGKEGEKHAK